MMTIRGNKTPSVFHLTLEIIYSQKLQEEESEIFRCAIISALTLHLYQSRKSIEKVITKRKSKRKVLLLLFLSIAFESSLFPDSTFFVASTACKTAID